LWLLPYLFFSVAADGLHNHELVPGWPHHSSLSRSRGPAGAALKAVNHTASDDDNCIACQWNSVASATIALGAVLAPPSSRSSHIDIAACSAPTVAELIRAGRGPPSL
jgi:hypothetical protein